VSRDQFENLFESLDRTRQISDAQIDELFSVGQLLAIVNTPPVHQSALRLRRRLWRRSSVVASVAVLLVGSAAAAITLSRGPVQTVASMTCYQGDSLSTTADVVSYNSDPLAYCSHLWKWPAPSSSPRDKGSLCLLTDGSLAAFPPARSFRGCKSLGLEIFNGKVADPDAAKFEIAAESYFAHHQCEARAPAREAMLKLLGAHGLVGWHVRVTGSSSPKACATLAILVTSHEVRIVGIRL
jgi:hypothetical protein